MSRTRAFLAELFSTAVQAVDPFNLVASRLQRDGVRIAIADTPVSWTGPTVIVGAGKASARMAAPVAATLGLDLLAGVVVAPPGGALSIAGVACLEGGHPLPNTDGEQATRRLVTLLETHPTSAVVALISGGASSLLVQPTPPVTLADKIAVNAALLACGADIHEFNTVRKHLSRVKGGGLARIARGRPLVALLLSDVIGDAPATIGSGPTAADPTTFAEAIGVLQRYDLLPSVPRSVVELLHAGARGAAPETIKPGAAELVGVANIVIGSNRTALEAVATTARRAGWQSLLADQPLSGDTTEAAHAFVGWVRHERDNRRGPLCLLAGGETTVRLGPGAGKGGRNQEFALACADGLAGREVQLLSAGTDGIDGPTDAAGAFADDTTLERAHRRGLDTGVALAAHDSYGFFDALGDLFRPGPTGTNVMDIKIALLGSPS